VFANVQIFRYLMIIFII